MMVDNDKNKNRKYIKISKDSGCISANYNISDLDKDMLIIPYENRDLSGTFKESISDKSK